VNPIQVGFLSLTGGAVSGDDEGYLRWHLLDHQPEQHTIPGLRQSSRWRMDEACLAARVVASDGLDPVRHAVNYLMGDPVDETLTAFARLGRRLAEAGRFPDRATSHLLGAYGLVQGYASPRVLVSAEAVPFRAHRGVVVVVESAGEGDVAGWAQWHHREHVPALLDAPGVAGVYAYRASARLGLGADQGERYGVPAWDPGDRFVTIAYLDDDVVATTGGLRPLLEARWSTGAVVPELAAPFRSMVRYEAWPDRPDTDVRLG
jgi:hypothetical protein